MIIVILSDTHISSVKGLDNGLIKEVKRADAVIHAGDYTRMEVVEGLKSISKRFYGVCGNMDGDEVKKRLKPKLIVELGGLRIGITHPVEGGPPLGIKRKVREKFEGVDLIVYGHTHFPEESYEDGLLCFNPGSATKAFPAFRKTYGILRVERGKVEELKVVKL